MKRLILAAGITAALISGCATTGNDNTAADTDWEAAALKNAQEQMGLQIAAIEADTTGKVLNPVTTARNRFSTQYCGFEDWRSGFFPGCVWYLYELTGDSALMPLAEKYTEAIADAQYLTWHHDIGFIINCSYGNGLRLANKAGYDTVMVNAAKSLCTRFRPNAGVIQSWNATGNSWQAKRGWMCPVIIDNMMNLELLLWSWHTSGDENLLKVAMSHADTTMKNHFREDHSSYHVVNYDPESGKVAFQGTFQGWHNGSSWARGQGWGLYGYTTLYRYTGERRYLDHAMAIADYILQHPHLPKDGIPYWDLSLVADNATPRDASAAAVIASALVELSCYVPESKAAGYLALAEKQLRSLASAKYTAREGSNGRMLLLHSTTSFPSGIEVDAPLSYADYYYLEALMRYKRLIIEKQNPAKLNDKL